MVNVLCYHSSNYHIFSKKFDSIYVKRLVTRTECWRIWLREGKQQQKLPNKEIHFYQTLWPMEFPSHAHSVQFLTVSRKHAFNLFPPLKCGNIAWGQDEASSPLQATYNELWCYRNHVLYHLKKSCIFAKISSWPVFFGHTMHSKRCFILQKKNQIHQRKEPRLASCTIRA